MAPWPGLAPYGRRDTLDGGRQLFIFDAGKAGAPPMLLIHGLGDEADSWRHVFGPLAEHFRVFAVDLPGFGRSDAAPRYTLPALVETLLGWLEAQRLPPAVLVGNSLGAVLAQRIALRRPERVAELVLVDGALVTRGMPPSLAVVAMALPFVGERIYTGFRRDPQAAYDSLRPYYSNLDGMSEADRQFLFQRVNERVWSDKQREAYLALFRDLTWSALWRQPATTPALARLSTPTRLIWGEDDHIVPPSLAKAALAIQPAARLTTIPGAGHLPHQERPEAFVEALLAPRTVQSA
jgi:pimeloyl-ACP methyl ester carboxylesterase